MIFLPWANIKVYTTRDLLWYLVNNPPPATYKQPAIVQPEEKPAKGEEPAPEPTLEPTPEPVKEETSEDGVKEPEEQPQPELQPPPQPLTIEQPKPALFAVIIGINEYLDPNIKDLSGAVPDANDVKLFLTETIGVPEGQITNLRNSQATRAAIEEAIRALAYDPRIKEDDAILIYYAGHGAEADAPIGWPAAGGKVQMLVPYDFISTGSSDASRGQGMLDVVIGQLLEEIARHKGNNITVIFDSCHSGSGSRDDMDPSFSTRGVELPKNYTIPQVAVDKAVGGNRAAVVAKGHEKSGLRSHVLLSACMKGETAKERHGRGAFTQAFLGIWREQGIDKLAYKDTVMLLPDLLQQNPQCEGENMSRTIFNAKVATRGRELFPVTMKKSDVFILDAGEAHGISNGAEFAVYPDRSMKEPLGSLKAQEVATFSSSLTFIDGQEPFELPGEKGFALQTRVGEGDDVKLYMELDQEFLDVFIRIKDEMERKDSGKRNFTLVESRDDQPDLFITADNGTVNFEIMDPTCRQNGLTHIPFQVKPKPDILYPILRSSADFYWNLRRSAKKSIIASKIKFECRKLAESGEFTDDFEAILMPDPECDDLNVGGTIHVAADDGSSYGLKITNTSAIPLYAALFYFNMSDLSICSYYQPVTGKGGSAEPSLPAGGSLTIGYGDSGTAPYTYVLQPNQDVDVGYLKLFLATEYVDWSNIPQDTPFKEEREAKQAPPKKRLLWDTMKFAVIQKRA